MARAKKVERLGGLRVRKLAKEDGVHRVSGFDSFTGKRALVDASTGQVSRKPLLGVMVQEAPERIAVPMRWVSRGRSEGWITLTNERVTHAPGGPESDPWRIAHTFVEADEIVIHGVEGNVVYEVTRQPGKYGDAGDGDAQVFWDYEATLKVS